MLFGTSVLSRESVAFYTPVLGFTTATFASSGTLAGLGAGAAAGGAAGAMAGKGMAGGPVAPAAPYTTAAAAGPGPAPGSMTIRQPAPAQSVAI